MAGIMLIVQSRNLCITSASTLPCSASLVLTSPAVGPATSSSLCTLAICLICSAILPASAFAASVLVCPVSKATPLKTVTATFMVLTSGIAAFMFCMMSFADRRSSSFVPKVRLPRLSSFGERVLQALRPE